MLNMARYFAWVFINNMLFSLNSDNDYYFHQITICNIRIFLPPKKFLNIKDRGNEKPRWGKIFNVSNKKTRICILIITSYI